MYPNLLVFVAGMAITIERWFPVEPCPQREPQDVGRTSSHAGQGCVRVTDKPRPRRREAGKEGVDCVKKLQ